MLYTLCIPHLGIDMDDGRIPHKKSADQKKTITSSSRQNGQRKTDPCRVRVTAVEIRWEKNNNHLVNPRVSVIADPN